MAVRVIVEVASAANWQAVVDRLLTAFGAEGVIPPTPEWRSHAVVLFPDSVPDTICDQLLDMPEILRAQLDDYYVGDPRM
ncbi:hypothetical protein [Streptomyces mirabilis]|uniref:hypothetical protein n=1 Tax=Streptomyces mirabilis TaxID=68239 RepID=UPI00224FB491|nr:hypothetical protein [Streptomyces mirabilis]MCX4435508.1 hypothetical protein [Streptomyces mirabilis]